MTMSSVPATWWLLLFACTVLVHANNLTKWDDGEFPEDARDPKFFSLLNVIRFKNVQCVGTNNLKGTCFARKECANINGVSSGSCARGWGTCCIIQKSCGDTTNLNCTYFSNTNYPGPYTGSGRCTITVNKCNSDICQLRLDLLDFTLAQPNADGECNDDSLSVTGGSDVPEICGDNTGQHIYVNFASDNTPIQVTVSTNPALTFNRKWNIKISQIECTNPEKAPTGCLMYYSAISGRVMSFNYAPGARGIDPPWTRELANLNYGVCVKMQEDYCTIQWSQCPNDPYSFTVSSDTGGLATDILGTATAALQGTDCTTDFVVIPNPEGTDGTAFDTDRFCGNGFVTKRTSSKPFVLTVVTNENEYNDDGTLADNENRGFCLSYTQMPCR